MMDASYSPSMRSLIVMPALLAFSAVAGYSQLTFESTKQQLKATAADERMEVTFKFKNTGTTPVTILEVDGNCGCLKAEADKESYAKGESGTINAVFTIGSKEGVVTNKLWVNYQVAPAKNTKEKAKPEGVDAPPGSVSPAVLPKNLTRTVSPNDKTSFLAIEMDIPSVISIEPKNTTWTLGDKPEPRKVKLTVNHDEPIIILGVESSRDNVIVTSEEVTPGREYILTLTPKSTEKVLLGMITIATDSKITKHQKKLAFFTVSRKVPSNDVSEIVPPLNPPGS